MNHVFGARVQFLRKRAGWQQADLARAAGLSLSYVSMLEQGRRLPSHAAAERLAAALEVPHGALYQREDATPMNDRQYRRLVEFAREATLTRKQEQRLIAVGRVLFPPREGEE